MNAPSILLWGFVATLVLTGTMVAAQGLGISRMSIPFMLGAAFTVDRQRALRVGFLMHMANGWIFAAVYAAGFQSLGRATWWMGALAGATHGLVALTVGMAALPSIHRNMATSRQGPTPTRWLQPPGFLALNYGRRTPLVALLAHVVYGTILGAFYTLA